MKLKFLLTIIALLVSNLVTAHASPPRSGQAIFDNSCKTCHATHFPDAPQAHDIAAWQKKYEISQKQVKQKYPSISGKELDYLTMQVLINKVKYGNKTMPPHGLCNDCSDTEYKNAIIYMMTKE